MSNAHPKYVRLVAVDGAQIAPAPRSRLRDAERRADREILLACIAEHMGHFAYSVERIQTLARDLEASLGISLPQIPIHPRTDALSRQSDDPA